MGLVDFDGELHGYTIGLLGLIAVLALPLPIAIMRGFVNHDDHGIRWRQAQDK